MAETPGAASVSPYPCSTLRPVRAVNCSRRSTESGAAPDTTLVTVLTLAMARSSERTRVSTAGATGKFVIFSSATTSAKPSNPSMITNRAPDMRALPSTALSPKTWNSGTRASRTSSGSRISKELRLCR